MVFVLNRNWGGFSLPQNFLDAYGIEDEWDTNIERDDPRLVKWVRNHANNRGRCGDLACVEIPDNCTDYEINDYDGMESITYVVDGKIHHT